MPTPPSGSVPVGNPQTGYLVKSSDLATVKIEGLDKLNPDDDMKTMVAKLQKLKPTVVGNAYRLNRILGEINARIGVGGAGGSGGTTVVQVGGGGSGGVVVATGLWSTSNNFLYPTATTTTSVLNGITSSDATNGFGSIVCTNVMGVVNSSINASVLLMFINGTTETLLHSSFSGTGVALPFSLYLSGVRYFTLQTSGALLGGLFTTDAAPTAGMIVLTSTYFLVTTATNASTFQIHAGSGVFEFISSSTGSGSIIPIRFSFAGTEVARIRTGGSWLFGLTSSDVGDTKGWIVEQGVFGIVNAVTNANALFLSVNGTTETVVHSSFSGAGTSLPLSFYVNGVRRGTFDTAGNLFVGALSITLPNAFFVGAGQNIWATDSIGISSTTGANTSVLFISTSPNEAVLASHITGTGTSLPISFYVSGNRRWTIETANGVLIGGSLTVGSYGTISGRILTLGDFIQTTGFTANESFVRVQFASGAATLESNVLGTGTLAPLTIKVGGEVARFTTTGQFLVGFNSISADYSATSGRIIAATDVIVATATVNSSFIRMILSAGVETNLQSAGTGSGTVLPLSFYVSGTRALTITTGQVIIGGSISTDLSVGVGTIVQNSGSGSGFIVISAATNASIFQMTVFSGLCSLLSNKTGTGTTLSINFALGGTEVARFDVTSLAFFVGTTSTDIAPTKGMVVATSSYFLISAATNASTFQLHMGSTCQVISSASGTGTTLPITWSMGGTEEMRLTTTGQFMVGITSAGDFSGSSGRIMASNDVVVATAATNAQFVRIIFTAGVGELESGRTGTGTFADLRFVTNATDVGRFTVAGAFLVGAASSDAFNSAGEIASLGVNSAVGAASAATNASFIYLFCGNASVVSINSGHSGTGTTLPITVQFFGVEVARFKTNGHLLLGLTSTDAASGLGDLYISSIFGILSAATNANALFMSINGTTETVIHSSFSGTGAGLPLSLYVKGNRYVTVTTSGTVLLSGLTVGQLGEAAGRLIAYFDVVIADSGGTNSHFLRLVPESAQSRMDIITGQTGTATALPLAFLPLGTEICRMTNTRVFINRTTDDGTGAVLQVSGTISSNGTVITVP